MNTLSRSSGSRPSPLNAANDVVPAVVVGGGSGHYPAFYGLVGEGLASGAAIGDVFTSPSGEQAYRVARAVVDEDDVDVRCV